MAGKVRFIPRQYQIDCATYLTQRRAGLVVAAKGSGKTTTALMLIQNLVLKGESKGALVVCNKSVAKATWDGDIDKFDVFSTLNLVKVTGPLETRKKRLNTRADIYITTYDTLPWLSELLMKNPPQDWPFDILILDESTYIKDPSTNRFKALRPLLSHFPWRVCLTATPRPNSCHDLWSQSYVVDFGHRLLKNITQFRDMWFYTRDPKKGGWKIKNKACEKEIYSRIKDIIFYLKKEDQVKIPPAKYLNILVDMGEDKRLQYSKFERERILEIVNEKNLKVSTIEQKMNKCIQLASGFLYHEDEVMKFSDHKFHTCQQLIQEADEPLCIVFRFTYEGSRIEDICKCLGKKVKFLNSDNAKAIQEEWNRGTIPVLLTNSGSASHGLNLQFGGRTVLWFTIPWSWEQYDQKNGRFHRFGITRNAHIIHLITEGTIDELLLEVQKRKARGQEEMNEFLEGNEISSAANGRAVVTSFKHYKNKYHKMLNKGKQS